VASGGYDVPAFTNMKTLKVWAEEGPPKGTLYTTPIHTTTRCCRSRRHLAAQDRATDICGGIMTKMTVRHLQGEPMEDPGMGGDRGRRLHAQLTTERRGGRLARAGARY
jgi:hypothetical protein